MQAKHSVILLLTIILAGCYARPAEKTGKEGTPMPAFDLLLPDSTTHFNTKSIPTGKPTVLFYFGSQCPYSHAQMEEIVEDMEILKGIQFLVFTTDSFQGMRTFSKKFQLNKYPNITVGFDYKHSFADYFEVPGVPYSAIYGGNKKLNRAYLGKVYGRQIKSSAEK